MGRDNLILLIGFVVAGLLGHSAADFINPPRVDPFTGAQGKALEARIIKLEKHHE